MGQGVKNITNIVEVVATFGSLYRKKPKSQSDNWKKREFGQLNTCH